MKGKKKGAKSFLLVRKPTEQDDRRQGSVKSFRWSTGRLAAARLAPLALALLTHLNSLTCGFTYDDRRAILENRNVAGSAPWSQLLFDDFWGTPMANAGSHKSYRPLVSLTFKLQALAFGLESAFVFHLLNLALHLCVVDRVFQTTHFILTKVIKQVRGQDSRMVACLTALLFACHPVHVEAVTSLVGRAELMGALFGLLSFQSFGEQLLGEGGGRLTQIKATLFATLALLSKENCGASTIVMNLLLWAWCSSIGRRPSKLSGVLVMLGLLGAVSALRVQLGGQSGAGNVILPKFSQADNPLAQEPRQFCLRQAELLQLEAEQLDSVCSNNHWLAKIERWMLLTRLYLPIFSLKLMIFPTELSYDWPLASIGIIKSPLESRFLVATFAYLALGVFVGRWLGAKVSHLSLLRRPAANKRPQQEAASSSGEESDAGSVRSVDTIRSEDSGFVDTSSGVEFQEQSARSKPRASPATELGVPADQVGWALAWLVVGYAPASNLLVPVGFLVAERALYLPSLGLCLLMAILLDQLASASRLSVQFGAELRPSSSSAARWSLKSALVAIGACGSEKRSTTRADTTTKLALVLPLLILLGLRSWHRNADWRDEVSLYSSNLHQSAGKSLANLASLSSGEPARQLQLYEAALRLEPRSAELHYNLALLLQSQFRQAAVRPATGEEEAAADLVEYHYKLALKLRKNFPIAALNLAAHQYEARGQLAEAWRTLEQCASSDQMSPSATGDFHRHVRIQIECLISGAKLRLPAGEERDDNNKQTAVEQSGEFADCQLALGWLAEAQRRARQLLVGASALSADDQLGDLSKQMATIGWLRAGCLEAGEPRARQLEAASQLALSSRSPVQAQLYLDWVAQLAPAHRQRALEGALAAESAKRGAQSNQLAQLEAALARLPEQTPASAWLRARRALALDPQRPALLALAARLAYEAGALQDSERIHAKLVQVLAQTAGIGRRKLASALANYGAILQVNGRLGEARQQYRRALEAEPSNSAAGLNLRKLDRIG